MRFLIYIILLTNLAPLHAGDFKGCEQFPKRQHQRSDELQKIVKADQDDRKMNPIDWAVVGKRDENRRKRVGEIFGEGCFNKAEDYVAAALVFQHGNLPEHALQCYTWAKEAVARGLTSFGEVTSVKQLALSGADRYLNRKNYKQLFATQTNRMQSNNDCRCLQPVEMGFTDQQRIDAGGVTVQEALNKYVIERNSDVPACGGVTFCDSNLQAPPRGILPGVW